MVMVITTPAASIINGNLILFPQHPSLKWRFGVDTDGRSHRTKTHAFRILANVSGTEDSKPDVVMVDPLEAKRLAAKQMQQIKARERFKRQRRIEAVNGAWAMIGLTIGLIIENNTGKSILDQLAGYLSAVFHIFIR